MPRPEPRYEDGFVIVGDEAWLPAEWEARRDRRAYYSRPDVKARQAMKHREWAERNREHLRAYKREWMRQSRNKPRLYASLHSLACTGPTIATGCVCNKNGTRKIRLYARPK